MNEDFILNYQPFPGNVPDKGYVPVSTRASKDAPSTSDMWEYVKLEQITDKDKEQIETNKQNIADLKQDVQTLETEIADKSTVSGKNDGTNWTKITIDGVEKNIPTGGGGGGFTPTQAQLDAMNSGINATKVAQIQTNTDDIANKVDKEAGKGLSTNDYTTAEKNKVALINSTETLTFTLQDDTTVTVKVVTGV